MQSSSIPILIVDDEPALLEVSKEFLEMDQDISADIATSAVQALEMIKGNDYDVIISDYRMPGKDGIQLLKDIRSSGITTPFILFTGKGREEVVIEALNAGADYYLQKGGQPASQFAELKNIIIKSSNKHQMEMSLKEKEEKFETIFDSAYDSIYILDLDGNIMEINKIGCDWLGYGKQDMLKKNLKEIDSDDNTNMVPERMKQVLDKGVARFEMEWMAKGGKRILVDVNARKICYAGQTAILNVARDISDSKKNEKTLRDIKSRLSLALEVSGAGVWEWNIERGEVRFDAQFHKMLGYAPGYLPTKMQEWKLYHHPDEFPEMISRADAYLRGDTSIFESEHRIRAKDGNWSWVFTRGKRLDLSTSESRKWIVGIAMNINDRKMVNKVE